MNYQKYPPSIFEMTNTSSWFHINRDYKRRPCHHRLHLQLSNRKIMALSHEFQALTKSFTGSFSLFTIYFLYYFLVLFFDFLTDNSNFSSILIFLKENFSIEMVVNWNIFLQFRLILFNFSVTPIKNHFIFIHNIHFSAFYTYDFILNYFEL